ncbi:MAG: type 1 glutamine amidotransferase domain-containing protein [Neomegalonema sp.]
MAQPRILMILTSHADLGRTGEKTGLWVEEFAAPLYAFSDAGFSPAIATIKGGAPAIDPRSIEGDAVTEAVKRYQDDKNLQDVLAQSPKLSNVATLGYDAVFLPGGHGTMWDFPTSPELTVMLEQFALRDKPIAAVCHAPAAFAPVMDRNGAPLVKGRKVSCFSDEEERAVGYEAVVPFLLESKLRQLGAEITPAAAFAPQVSVDGNLITGQNPASSLATAQAMIDRLNASAEDVEGKAA